MSAIYPASASSVPARKWHNLAEEVLKDPDGFYSKVEKEAAERHTVTSEAPKTSGFVWPWKKR
jgi:hypothetical protein